MITTQQHIRFTPPAPQCIWTQAGVVRHKLCRLDFECHACRFDKAMCRIASENKALRRKGHLPKGKRGKISFWHDRLKTLPLSERPCIHHMKERIEFRPCTNDYQCNDCEFDQYFHDEFTVHTVVKPVSVLNIEGFKIPQGYYLHSGHTWVKLEENSEVRIGVDDFAMRVFGPPDRVSSPLVGKVVTQNASGVSFHRGRHTADVLSPVSGVVTAVNANLRENGDLSNRHPYDDGWILRVHAKNLRQDIKSLMIGSEATTFLKEEISTLYRLIEQQAGPLAADGGYLANDIFGNLPQIGWDTMRQTFLRT
ncbi:MAG: glycine cleavage system protein H [Deltaproteobacteria bacterium]